MRVFVAGSSGTVGIPLVRALVSAGHQVTALTRSPEKQAGLLALGATPAVADALDRDALIAVVGESRPTHVIHQLTALPKAGPSNRTDLQATNRLRIEGTRHLLDAAVQAGARRVIAGSFAMLSMRGESEPHTREEAAVAVQSMEAQVLEATASGLIEGVILRYGMFYGFEAQSTATMIELVRKRRMPVVGSDKGLLPVIHVSDAVSATVAALDRAPAGSAYDIVDDRAVSLKDIVETLAKCSGSPAPRHVPDWLFRLLAPYAARLISLRIPLSNAKAKDELGWRPEYSTMVDGLSRMFRKAA